MRRNTIGILTSVLIIMFWDLAHGSDWSLPIGGTGTDRAYSIQQTADGGYIVAGYTYSFGAGGADAWVLKLNANGSVAWQKTYGGTNGDWASSIQQTADGGYIVAGFTSSFGAGGDDAWVLKLNDDGSVAWQHAYGRTGSELAYSIQQTADGGFIVAGSTNSFGAGGNDAWVFKLHTNTGFVDWQKTFGGTGDDVVTSIHQTADGGYIVAGYTDSFGAGSYDAWVLKLNADGSVAWQKTYGGTGNDSFASIQQTADGGYIVTGSTNSFGAGGSGDAWVLKLNADGSVAWQKTYGGTHGDLATSIRQTADGGYIVAGITSSFGGWSFDAWVFKLNADGSIAWQKSYGGTGSDHANSIRQTADGGYIVAGYTSSFGAGGDDAWVLELDKEGGVIGCGNVTIAISTSASPTTNIIPADSSALVQTSTGINNLTTMGSVPSSAGTSLNCSHTPSSLKWQKTYGGSGDDLAYSIQQTPDGGYIAAGITSSSGAGDRDAWVLKLNANGSVAWQKTYGGASYDVAISIQQTPDGGYIVAGYTYSFGAGWDDAWVLKLDANASVTWQKTYGGANGDMASSIQQTGDGGYIIAGLTNSFGAGGSDAWVFNLDPDGSVAWQKTYGGTGNDGADAIQQTADGGYIIAGHTNSFGAGGYDTWVLKLNANGSIAWQKTYGGTGLDLPHSIQQLADGGYIIAGMTESFGAGYWDVWVLKLDQEGGITGCSQAGSTKVVPQASAGTVGESNAGIYSSWATVQASSPTENITSVTPGEICSSSYTLHQLELLMAGRGTGRVTSSPSGIDCTTDCSRYFTSPTLVTLKAYPDPHATFTGWSGACDTGGEVRVNADVTCIAGFNTPADFAGNPRYGYVPFRVDFYDLSTISPTSWSWDFGDANTSSSRNPSHVYLHPGFYTVTLAATGAGVARKIDYITAGTCQNKGVRITGPAYYDTITAGYGNLIGSGNIDLHAIEFVENVTMSSNKTVTLTGGYPCEYGSRIGASLIKGKLTIGGPGTVTVAGITIE